jgi:hypothetical protein
MTMRIYNIDNQEVVLLYRYIDQGIEITTKWNNKLIHQLYRPDLSGYSELSDLIDDLSTQFLKEELIVNKENKNK